MGWWGGIKPTAKRTVFFGVVCFPKLSKRCRETAFPSGLCSTQEVPKEEDSEVKTLVRRNQMMQKLLAVLDGAARLGRGPTMKDFIPEGEALHELKTAPNLERYSNHTTLPQEKVIHQYPW